MFRTVFVLALMAGAAFMAGWFTIDRTDSETTIKFNRDEIRSDASKAIAKGREFLNKTNAQSQGEQNQGGYQQGGQYAGQYPQQQNGYPPPPNGYYPTPANYPQTNQPAGYQGQPYPQQPAGNYGQDASYPPYGGQQATRPVPPWEVPNRGPTQY